MKKIIFVSYFLFLLFFIVFSYLFVDPGLFYFRFLFTNYFQVHRIVVSVLFIAFLCIFFLFYFLFLHLTHQHKLSKNEMYFLLITSCLLLFAYPAMLSFDIFNYIATAKVTFFYHENPYILMPIEFIHDPLLLFMHAANKTALYAPFWILLTGIPYILGFGNFLQILLNFKILVVLFYFATVWLLWHMTKDILKTVFFALNPLVLIESLVSSHNDIVMMFLLLFSLYLLQKKKLGWGILFYLLSILIKYTTLILLPVYWYISIKRRELTQKVYLWIAIYMYIIFFLSSFREEIYPWYSIWFLLPVSFIAGDNLITWISVAFSFSMLLRYIPFMLLGTYFGPTPILKITLMLTPVALSIVAYVFTHKKKVLI